MGINVDVAHNGVRRSASTSVFSGPQRRATRRRNPWTSLGASLATEAVLVTGYAQALTASLRAPESALARVLASWNDRLRTALQPLFDWLGGPPCAIQTTRSLLLYHAYIQLLVVDLAVAGMIWLVCFPFWGVWGRSLRRHRFWRRMNRDQVESVFEAGEALALAGVLGAFWLLMATPYPAVACFGVAPLFFLRPPVVTTVAYAFGCLATAFGMARAPAQSP